MYKKEVRSKKKKKKRVTRKFVRFFCSFVSSSSLFKNKRARVHSRRKKHKARGVVFTSICERENHHGAGEEEERDDEEQEETNPRVGNRLLALFKVRQNERR